jgi:Domain of unknown function (DUF6259)
MFEAGEEGRESKQAGEPDLFARTAGLEIRFDGGTGGILRIENLWTGQVLTDGTGAAPWRMVPQGTAWGALTGTPAIADEIIPAGFGYELGPESLRLRWDTSEPGLRVSVLVTEDAPDRIGLWPAVEVDPGALPPAELTYPIVPEPAALSPGGGEDYLLFPAHTGVLVRTPQARQPLDACYPDGYSGCPVQVSGYYAHGDGGFYLAAHDVQSTWKNFHFSAAEWSMRHEAFDLGAGKPMALGYPVVLGALTRGDWYEAAKVYREWALEHAPWCQNLAQAAQHVADGVVQRCQCAWMFDEVGLAVWGGPSSLDWSPWFQFYGDVAGTPLHITSGWDWPSTRPNTVGKEGWLPPRLHAANIGPWQGHYVTPYMNDIFISSQAEGFLTQWEPTLMYPYVDFTWSRFTHRTRPDAPRLIELDPRVTTNTDFFPCPAADEFADLHAWRDAGLMEHESLAGVCYDISSGNPMLWSRCWRTEHGHPPGRGRAIITAYNELNKRSKAEARRRTGRYLVQGVETIIENIVDSVDFYVARAGAGPLGVLESWLPQPEEPPGHGFEVVPLFDAIYHDVGPVRQDGWLTLGTDIGDLFYWAAARIVLQWGAMLSLHYANNPPERLPERYAQRPAELIDWDGSLVRFDDLPELDQAKAEFTGELARARTALGPGYLSRGVLLRPVPPAERPMVTAGYRRHMESAPRLRIAGQWEVPQIVHGAWGNAEGDVALYYANVGAEPVTASIDCDLTGRWDTDAAGRIIRITDGSGSRDAGRVGTNGRLILQVPLPARHVVLVELLA